jgi:hypothetical protein
MTKNRYKEPHVCFLIFLKRKRRYNFPSCLMQQSWKRKVLAQHSLLLSIYRGSATLKAGLRQGYRHRPLPWVLVTMALASRWGISSFLSSSSKDRLSWHPPGGKEDDNAPVPRAPSFSPFPAIIMRREVMKSKVWVK